MAGSKVLVLGGTGPAGIVLSRELLFRGHATVAYVRSPDKIPKDLADNALLEVITGQLDDDAALALAIAQARVVISLLGPQLGNAPNPSPIPGYYTQHIFPLMRHHGVRRILASSTISVVDDETDSFVLTRWLLMQGIKRFVPGAYDAVTGIARAFREEAGKEIEWTVYRVAGIPGGSSEEEWKRDREDGKGVYVGPVARTGWTMSLNRSRLARWLVDVLEGEEGADGEAKKRELVGKMPAVSFA